MKAELKNGNLVVTIPTNGKSLNELPDSKSGKTLILASSGGNQPTTVNIGGKPVYVGFNAYVKK